ncbi:MAG TPA: ABC transporter permease [Solirubrobacteraceae bacterium]|nr:ABC transporter permease [Solirubrobacteraceae bacterium]
MFFLTYLRRELSHRLRQAVLIATGLAVGVALVVTVTAASAGVSDAQRSVLHALYGIGTDVTITKGPPAHPSGHFFSPGPVAEHEDVLGVPPGLGALSGSSVASVARLRDVAAAAGGLTLTDTKLTVPSVGSLGRSGRPPAGALGSTFTVDGVDLSHLGLGPFASGKPTSGRGFAAGDASSNLAVLDGGYAAASRLKVGSRITIANHRFKVIGIVRQPQGGGAADVYIPLARAQALAQFQGASLNGKLDAIYVAAASAPEIPAVQAEIARLLPSATVTSSASLASAVSGSLATAASLANDLGKWLAVAGLIVAFAVASLMTMGAVARRVRELGTLKALGWPSRRIVAQLLGESALTGVIGAAIGIALGFAGAALVGSLSPKVSATVAQNPGSAPPQDVTLSGSGTHHFIAPGSTHTIAVHLAAPITISAVVLAVVLAIAGALIAGTLGGWRAARMSPAESLAQVA